MQKLTKWLTLAMLLVILAGVGDLCHARKAGAILPLKVSLEPSGPLQKGAPITMNLTFVPTPEYIRYAGDTGSVSVSTVRLADKSDTLTKTSWPIRFDDEYTYSTTFEITIPDNDLIQLSVYTGCGQLHGTINRYFTTTGETVEYSATQVPKLPSSRPTRPLRDTLTYEQLQTEHEIILDFRGPSSKKNIEGIVGPIPDSCLFDRVRGYYKIKITLENLIKLNDELPNEKIGLKFVTPPPWSRKYRPPEDSLLEQKDKPDESDPQGALPAWRNPNSPDGISLDSVSNLTIDGKLPTGELITFYIHIKNPYWFTRVPQCLQTWGIDN